MPAILGVAAVTLAACATSRPAPMVETGYERGALAVAAIERQDWSAAERLLTEGPLSQSDDPARLINLGQVYMETGRTGEALSMWRLALASERHSDVVTRDGRVVQTDALAREALAMHDHEVRSAAR